MIKIPKMFKLLILAYLSLITGSNGEDPCSAETPDDGWKSAGVTELDDYCYMKISQARDWQYSHDHCIHHGGNLASIHSKAENDYINGDYWIGLIKVHPGGQLRWSDNTNFEFTNWGDGEPNDYLGYEDCTSMRSDDGKWNDEFCSNTHGFVCKKIKDGHNPTDAPPTQIPKGHCADNDKKLTEFQGHCYKFAATSSQEWINWEQADSKCKELGDGFKLASIHSERESSFILSMLAQLNSEDQETEMWIAANDAAEEQEGIWSNSDGTPFDYTHWADGEPNGSDYQDEDCASMYGLLYNPGKWNDAECSNTKGVLCKAEANPDHENPPSLETCDEEGLSGYVRFNGGCYRWANEPKTWSEAEADCSSENGHLVSIWDELEQAYTFSAVQNVQSWIGLKKEPTEEEYRWSDESFLSYYNWLANQNMTSSEERCAILDTDRFQCTDACEYPDGNWIVVPCTETHPYMCKYKKDERTYCPASTGLSYDWVKENDHCYHLFGLNASYWAYQGERTFEEARLYCQAMGGDLMSIESQDEQDNVLPQIIPPYSMYKNFWIGLERKLDANGEEYPADYEWVDGTQSDFQHFAAGYPDSHEGQHRCITADPYYYMHEWMNDNCELRMPFACEVIASQNPTTIAPPTPTPDAPCRPETPNDGWIKFTADDGGSGDWCFKFNNDIKDWVSAKQECEFSGGRLASIHSQQENDFITRKLAEDQASWDHVSWIGLQRDYATGQFVWIDDGSNPEYDKWGDGEPNDADDMESCANLNGDNGFWNDESCYTAHTFVCKKPVDGDWPQPSPTSIPEGHCSADFTEYQGYCYKILGLAESEERHDWHFAKDHCRDDYKSELASFHSAREAAKAVVMLASSTYNTTDDRLSKIWIGGYESYDSVWWWTDETQWQFTNWAPGEPNDMNYYEYNCATMYNSVMGSITGMWDDGNCTMRHPYMCKTTASTDNPDPPPSPPMCDESNHADFAQFNGACYKWINEPKSWSDAEDDCKQKGAHLVSIIDPVEQAYVFTELQSNKAWIGLSNMDNKEIFAWSDGWNPLNYINWGHEDNTKAELCGQMNVTNDGKWDAVSCDSQLPYMCKFSSAVPPTPNPKGQCPYGYQDMDPTSDYCYFVRARSVDLDGSSWGDANTKCIADGGSLASIHNDGHQDALYNEVKKGVMDVWIGLQANNHKQWNWIDYSPYDYNHWNDGEPNSNDDSLYCGKIYKSTGFWDDTWCMKETTNGYVCQKRRVGTPTPPPSAATRTGGISHWVLVALLMQLVVCLFN